MLDFGEYIGSLLAVLVSLRIFVFETDIRCPIGDAVASLKKASDRAPHLEYFATWRSTYHYWKRIGGEWVICGKTEFPSLVQ
jgi:hypothetical protein